MSVAQPEEGNVRLNVSLDVSAETGAAIRRLAKERNLQNTSLVLQALGVLQISHDAAKEGYYLGLSKDRSKLDTVIVSPF